MMSKSNLLKERGCVKNFLLARRFLSLLRELERKPSQGNSTSNLFRTLVISTRTGHYRIQPIDGIKYYWLKDAQNSRKLVKRFQRTKLFALRNNFSM